MVRVLSPELAKIAKEELNENPKQIANDLRSIKDWISKQPHLIARTDDQWLLAILRGCKFSLERVKAKLDLFYTLRTTAPEITLRLKPTGPEFLQFLRLGTCFILPQSESSLHPAVIVIRPGLFDPDKNNVADVMCILYYLVQILVIECDAATVLGTKIVVDYQGCGMNHMTQASPTTLKKLVAVSQDSLPLRLKGSHHINVPSGIEIVFKITSGFINQKARDRLKIHKSSDELLEHLPKEIVPVEYGGTGMTVPQILEYWAGKLSQHKAWLDEECMYGTDESKRQGSMPGAALADQGSFRTLEID